MATGTKNELVDNDSSNKKIKAYSVNQINELIRRRLQSDKGLLSIWIEGEVFNLTRHSSGHIYFSLKDKLSQIRCTFFKGSNIRYRQTPLANGSQILVFGSISLYQARGEYQFNVQSLMPIGEGELRLKIEALKKKIDQEGLFDAHHKKELPQLIRTLGIATAATGAAIQDILRVAINRYPNINIILAPCKVQGEGAVQSICNAVEILQKSELKVDAIIVGRGGGSFEDLLAFNDEKLLRVIFKSRLPIISAVGHEIDSPLSDLIADKAAPTPSIAAEMLVPDIMTIAQFLLKTKIRLQEYLERHCLEYRERLRYLHATSIFEDPLSILRDRWQNLDHLKKNINQAIKINCQRAYNDYERFRFLPAMLYEKLLAKKLKQHEIIKERLETCNMVATLKRGYAIIHNKKNKSIRSINEIQTNDNLKVTLADGSFVAEVSKIYKNKTKSK